MLLSGLCALDECCLSLRLCVLPCGTWANMCSPGLCSCRDYVRSTVAVRALACVCCPPVRGPICVIPDRAPAGTMCARHVLSERSVLCASLRYVGQLVVSRIVLLPGLCLLDVCCPSIGLCVLPCGTWANMCSPGSCSCRNYVRSTCAVQA